MKWDKLALFAGGALFSSTTLKILTSKDAKKVYTHTTAAVLRMKESVMTTVTSIKENAGDILADAKQINEDRIAAEEAVILSDEEPEIVEATAE